MRAAPASNDDVVDVDDFEIELEVFPKQMLSSVLCNICRLLFVQVKKKRKVPKARANKKLQLFASCRFPPLIVKELFNI